MKTGLLAAHMRDKIIMCMGEAGQKTGGYGYNGRLVCWTEFFPNFNFAIDMEITMYAYYFEEGLDG